MKPYITEYDSEFDVYNVIDLRSNETVANFVYEAQANAVAEDLNKQLLIERGAL